MKRKTVFKAILLSFLVTYTVCEEEPNHLFTKSYSEVAAGFKNPSARHADVPLRSRQHKFPVHTAPVTESSSSDDERIGSLDGRILLASADGLNPRKWNTDVGYDKIKKASTMRKLAVRRSARKQKVVNSSRGARRLSSSSVSKDSKGKDKIVLQTTFLSSSKGEPNKRKIYAPLRLSILPTEETVIPSVDTADTESDDDTGEGDEEKSSHSNDHKDDTLPHGEPKVAGHEGSTRHGGTSAIPQHKMAVYPGMKTSSDLRWKASYDHAKVDESKKVKHSKKKKEKSDSKTEEPAGSHSPAAIVAGILAGILVLWFILNVFPRWWRIFKKQWRERYGREFGKNDPAMGYLSEELSEEEVIFDRAAMERNKKSSMSTSPKSTPNTSPGRPKSTSASYQPTDHETQEQKIWTLTTTPKSTPLMVVPTLDDTPSTEVWTINEISESNSLDSSFTTSSLSDLSACNWTQTETPRSASLTAVSSMSLTSELDICSSDLQSLTPSLTLQFNTTEETIPSSFPSATRSRLDPYTPSELTIPESSLTPNPSTSKEFSNLCLLPSASDELTRSLSMATDSTSSSTESCKTPVAPRNEVVITMDDDDDKEIIYTSEKSQHEDMTTVNDVHKETSREELVIRMEHADGEDESLMLSESEAASVEMIYRNNKLRMDNATDDAVIDIVSSNDENEGPFSVNDDYKNEKTTLTLPTIPPPTASTELRQGKSLIGGRKALENRRFIKHLISEQESTGFKRDLNTAISRILGEKKRLEDKNKGKRNVIKNQTQEAKYSLAESILRAKSMIMNENVVKERDKRSFLCRQVIQQTLSYPVRPTIRPRRTLAQEIAFAKEIILPGHPHPRTAVRTKVERQVRCEHESINPMDKGASTSNSETRTMYLSDKDYHKWKLIHEDVEIKKAKGINPGAFVPGLKLAEDFYDFPLPAIDHDKNPQAGCRCYYCRKHNKKARGRRFFKLPRKLLPFKSKSSTKQSRPDSESYSLPSSAAVGPSTFSAANGSSGLNA
ncbi:uncharacterized protein LOC144628472 isoform X2 [Oculina patagonica]